MRLTVPVQLRWSDLDAYAHVNNAEMLRLLEEARIAAFWATDDGSTGDGVAGGAAVIDGRPGAETQTLIARQEIEYLHPIPYLRAPIDIELWIGNLGGASLQICYEVFSPPGVAPRVLFTRASTTLVMVSTVDGRPRRIGDAERDAWRPYVEAPIVFAKR